MFHVKRSLVVALAALALAVAPVSAQHSVAYLSQASETNGNGSLYGVSASFTDAHNPGGDGTAYNCTTLLNWHATPVAMAVTVTFAAGYDVNFGFVTQCNNNHYIVAWTTSGGVPYQIILWTSAPTSGTHTYTIEGRYGNGLYDWRFLRDGSFYGSFNSGYFYAIKATVGLQSWAEYLGVPSPVARSYSSLTQKNTLTTWASWSGFDSSIVQTPYVCGHWASATSWVAGTGGASGC